MALKSKKMAFENKHFLPYLIIITTLLISLLSSCCCTFSLNHHDDPEDGYNLQKESGYDSPAYPSYFGHLRGVKFDNYFDKKFRRSALAASSIEKLFNVLDFGAEGDGSTDDTKAFEKAWTEVCSSSSGDVNLMVPQNKNYLLKPIRFSGPCTSNITMQIAGTIIASDNRSDYSKDLRHWLIFDSVQNLVVTGGGIINGNGNIWWKNSCRINKTKPCTNAPTALTLYRCTNLVVQNLKIENAQQMHVTFEKSTNVVASNLVVTSPGNSPNTDGIHLTATQNIQISNCTIGTGDDCISIVSGSEKVRAMDITCGPGHGISIGSLGYGNAKEYVSDVVINGAKLSGTTNGVRIKTWQGGAGSASNIKFQNIEMKNVKNPIIIDQNYCDQNKPCQQQASLSSAVQVTNVVYQNIKGTSATDVAIDFDCSRNHPCQGIVMQDVSLVAENGENKAKAVCKNVDFVNIRTLISSDSGSFSPGCPAD